MSFGGKGQPLAIKYVPQDKRKGKSQAGRHMTSLFKSDFDRSDFSGICTITEKYLKDGCIYLPNFFCKSNDRTYFNKILKELEGENIVDWSKHQKFEDPTFSPTFNELVQKMSEHFKVKVFATRLNYYRDGSDFKPFHHDSHAYLKGTDIKEDFTMGASFGASRDLVFMHPESKNKFSFPQNNGDIFAFNSEVNSRFMHGVPKASGLIGPRISIIAWGKRQ